MKRWILASALGVASLMSFGAQSASADHGCHHNGYQGYGNPGFGYQGYQSFRPSYGGYGYGYGPPVIYAPQAYRPVYPYGYNYGYGGGMGFSGPRGNSFYFNW